MKRSVLGLVMLFGCGPTSALDKVEPPPRMVPSDVSLDAGVVDAAPPHDAGRPPVVDAGLRHDAGPPPSPPPDAGQPIDAHTPDDCITNTSVGAHVFECDGITYHINVPPRCAMPGCGVIFDVHGFTMSGPMEETTRTSPH